LKSDNCVITVLEEYGMFYTTQWYCMCSSGLVLQNA